MLIDLVEVPKELKNIYNSWKAQRDIFLSNSTKQREYYFADVEGTNTNYRRDQVQKIISANLIPVSINYIYPQISQKLAILNQNKYGFKIASTDGRFKEVAYIMEKAKDLILYSSEALLEIREAIKDALITGVGHLSWVFEYMYSPDEGLGLKLMHMPHENIILDPNIRKRTNIDARGYFYVNTFTSDVIEQIFTPYLNVINEYYGKQYTIDDLAYRGSLAATSNPNRLVHTLEQRPVEIIKYYTKQYATMYLVDVGDGIIHRIFRENYFPEEFDAIINTGEVISEYTDRFVKETTIINDKIIEIKIIDSRDYLLNTLYYDWDEKPYKSKGAVHFIIGMQQVIDKVMQDLLFNAGLVNAQGWTAPVDSIPEQYVSEWQYKSSAPSIKYYIPKLYENMVLKPERDVPIQLPAHYVGIINLMYESMKISTGINEITTGDLSNKLETFSTAQLYQNAAMMRISEFSDYITHFIARTGQILTDLLPGLLKPDTHYQFFNSNENDFDELMITKSQLNLLNQMRFFVTVQPSSLSPSARASMVTSLMNIAQATPDPYQKDIYIKTAYEMADMRGFDKLKKDIDTVNNLKAQLQSLEEQIQRNKELMKQWENRVIRAELEAEILKQQMSINARLIKAEEQAKMDTIAEKLESELKETKEVEKE